VGNMRDMQSFCPEVVSATFVCVKYWSSSLDKSYGSNEDWLDSETIVEGKRVLLGTHPGLMMGKHLCQAQYLFSTYFRIASWYWVLYKALF